MFFFFVDGAQMLKRLMVWSPLPDEYDMRIFSKFRAVSYSTMVSTFVTAAAQGVVGAIGFAIIGLPVFFSGILIGITSLLPYIGSVIIYVPTSLYLMLTGHVGQGIFLLAWGAVVIGNIDNVLRTYMIKGKAGVNPIFIFFSIIGGVMMFGFWGVVLGPLIISIAITIMHIYEQEFGKELRVEVLDDNISADAAKQPEIAIDIKAKKDKK
jgi:predicted PurR-regulated permease PerM